MSLSRKPTHSKQTKVHKYALRSLGGVSEAWVQENKKSKHKPKSKPKPKSDSLSSARIISQIQAPIDKVLDAQIKNNVPNLVYDEKTVPVLKFPKDPDVMPKNVVASVNEAKEIIVEAPIVKPVAQEEKAVIEAPKLVKEQVLKEKPLAVEPEPVILAVVEAKHQAVEPEPIIIAVEEAKSLVVEPQPVIVAVPKEKLELIEPKPFPKPPKKNQELEITDLESKPVLILESEAALEVQDRIHQVEEFKLELTLHATQLNELKALDSGEKLEHKDNIDQLKKQTLPEKLLEAISCPISSEILVDPVTTIQGISYHRPAIEKWLKSNTTDPMTNEELKNNHPMFIPNYTLKSVVHLLLNSTSAPIKTRQEYEKEQEQFAELLLPLEKYAFATGWQTLTKKFQTEAKKILIKLRIELLIIHQSTVKDLSEKLKEIYILINNAKPKNDKGEYFKALLQVEENIKNGFERNTKDLVL